MGGTVKPTIAVLFDHELREAAAALQEAWGIRRGEPNEDEKRQAQDALSRGLTLATHALWAIRPTIDAIIVIKRDMQPTPTEPTQ